MPILFSKRPFSGTAAMLCMTAMLVVGLPSTAVADNHPIKVYRLGNPDSAISKTPARTAEDVQRLVKQYETSLRVALAQSTFDGDPQDLFDAIARGDGEMISITPGMTHQWMVFRQGGQPVISSRAVEWAGAKPIDAYRTTVASGRYVYTFDIPLTCINLALYERKEAALPTCELKAMATTPSGYGTLGDVNVTATGSGDVRITGISGPAGAIAPDKARSTGTNAWTFTPTAQGPYEFTATVTDDYGRGTRCTANARVAAPRERPVPVCNLNAVYSADPDTITLDASGSKGTVTISSVTLPDGSAGDLGMLNSAGNNRWTFSPKLSRRAGDYTFTFAGEANLPDAAAPVACDASTTVSVVRAGGDWILRGYGARIDGDDDVSTDLGFEQTYMNLGKGAGVGLGLEYLFSERWGVEAGILFGELDSDIFVDRADLWLMAEDEVSFRPVMLGLHYHLTPGRKADFYLGPFVALVQYGSARFNLGPLGARGIDYDDEFGFGLNLGVDVPFGSSRWGFNGGLRYLATTAEEDDGGLNRELDIDPLIFSAGLGFRF